jgi:hypothetical protein
MGRFLDRPTTSPRGPPPSIRLDFASRAKGAIAEYPMQPQIRKGNEHRSSIDRRSIVDRALDATPSASRRRLVKPALGSWPVAAIDGKPREARAGARAFRGACS